MWHTCYFFNAVDVNIETVKCTNSGVSALPYTLNEYVN